MQVRVRLFASLRETAGTSDLRLDLPAGASPEEAWRQLVAAHPQLAARRPSLACSVNRRYERFDTALSEGDELVFIPPVSGG